MSRAPKGPPIRRRPYPPSSVGSSAVWPGSFAPAPELAQWVEREILADDGHLFNPDHRHLRAADIGFLWALTGFERQGRRILGMCEKVQIQGHRWAKRRGEDQLEGWFGRVPVFLVTLAADYCSACSDVEFCALLEHELYHVGHEHRGGVPQFTQSGGPRLAIRGHDVEEFVGVVARYGIGEADGSLARLVDVARQAPTVAPGRIAAACGLCALKLA